MDRKQVTSSLTFKGWGVLKGMSIRKWDNEIILESVHTNSSALEGKDLELFKKRHERLYSYCSLGLWLAFMDNG